MENRRLQFLEGGGEMGNFIRNKNWVETAVGSPEQWPQSLRTALSIILHSRFPMFLFWGKSLTCFYNDAYRPSLGNEGKHPSILGMSGENAWPEIWDFIKPIIDSVLQKKEASWNEDQLLPIFRNGQIEDVYWTFSYSPVIDETGAPAGVFVTCSETTSKVLLLDNLQESRNQLEFAIEAAELGTFDYSPISRKFTANNRLKQWFGLGNENEINLQDAIDAILYSDKERVSKAIEDALIYESGGKYDLFYTIVHPGDSSKRVVHAKGKTTFNFDKIAVRLDGTLQDITTQVNESLQREEALEKASTAAKHLALALEAGKLGAYELDIETGKIECSTQCKTNFGTKPSESISYDKLMNMVLPEDLNQMKAAFHEAVTKNKVYDATYRILVADEIRWIHASAMPMYDAEGKVTGMAGVTANITEQKNNQLKINAALEEIELSREKLNIVIDSSELGTWELNFATQAIQSSPRFAEIFGFKNHIEFDINTTRSRIHADDLEKRNEAHRIALETGKMQYVGRIIWQDGSVRWIESKGKVFFSDIGKPEVMIGTIRDITDEKQKQQTLRDSEQKFRLLADSMPQHVWTSDVNGNLNYFNQSVFDYSGLTLEQIEADGWIQIVHPDDRPINIETWTKAISEGSDFILEHRFRKADGKYRWQLSRAVPQRDHEGKIQMWVGTSTDIQEQRTFTEELEKRVQERTQEMKEKNMELEAMNKELQTFAYISSHDLQEPLRKIQTFSELISHGEAKNLSIEGLNYFHRMQKAAARMQTLINDLLAYSKTNNPEKIFEEVNIKTILDEIKDEVSEELIRFNATIEIGETCKLKVIHYQFRQLLHNLISNSLKFRVADIAPKIKISCTIVTGKVAGSDADRNYTLLRFEDNGIGFDQKHADKIFDLFQRLHGKESYEGTGIGLSIVKKIVDNHNGQIFAEGAKNKGAKFNIYFPI